MSLMTEYEYCYSVAMPAKRWLDCSGKGILFTSTHTEYHVVPCSHRISFVALLWRLSNSFVPFCCGTHTCTQCSRWGHAMQSTVGQYMLSLSGSTASGSPQRMGAPWPPGHWKFTYCGIHFVSKLFIKMLKKTGHKPNLAYPTSSWPPA